MGHKSLFDRSNHLINLQDYSVYCPPIDCGVCILHPPYKHQYVLRMMVRGLNGAKIDIPKELKWLENLILRCSKVQSNNNINHKFIYVTVRHGLVTSETDDQWHVDGHSMRVPHLPEYNYICSTRKSTEILEQPFDIPTDFNSLKHNIHMYFQDHADETKKACLLPNRLYVIDPYIVHRRPSGIKGIRTFVRVSFLPIEIEDNTCTKNPLMQSKYYEREDIRKTLIRY